MSVSRLDTLFYRPWSMGVILQKFFVVISLDHERLYGSQAFSDQFGYVTEIRDKSEAA